MYIYRIHTNTTERNIPYHLSRYTYIRIMNEQIYQIQLRMREGMMNFRRL